jgi:hypothetical protein
VKQALRRRLLYLALAATLAAAVWVAREDAPRGKPGPAVRTAGGTPLDAALRETGALRLPERVAAEGAIIDPFYGAGPVTSGGPRAGTPAKPAAPALPFVVLGLVDHRGEKRLALSEGEQMHLVKVGDIIDGRYRVDHIGTELRLTYLPLKEVQVMTIGDMQ